MEQRALLRQRPAVEAKSSSRLLLHDELLEGEGVRGERSGRLAQAEEAEFVTQSEQARRLEPDDRDAALHEWREGREHTSRPFPRSVHETTLEQSTAAARGPAAGALGIAHAIAGTFEHAYGGVGVFWF